MYMHIYMYVYIYNNGTWGVRASEIESSKADCTLGGSLAPENPALARKSQREEPASICGARIIGRRIPEVTPDAGSLEIEPDTIGGGRGRMGYLYICIKSICGARIIGRRRPEVTPTAGNLEIESDKESRAVGVYIYIYIYIYPPPVCCRCDDSDGCTDDPIMQRVTKRMTTIARLPEENAEYFQILRRAILLYRSI